MNNYGSIKRLTTLEFRQNSQEVVLEPNQGTTYTATRTLQFPPGDSSQILVGDTASQTLTNKVISGASNTLTVRAASDITGQLPLANGGTGQASASAAFIALSPMTTAGDLIYENSSPVPARLAIGATGNVLTVSGGLPVWAAPATNGTVTSVALTVPGFLSVSGSPITTSGTLAITLATETANTVFSGPASGGAATPTFRALVVGDLSFAGSAGGVATLDGGGKVPAAQLPSTLMNYRGAWDASTNTPTLADGTGSNGDVYRASVAGTQNLGSGAQTWAVGDFAIYNGTIWQHSPAADGVSSVNGSTGAVTVNAINQLTGDVTTSAASQSQSKAATVAAIQGTTVSGTTGTGNVVFSASPTLTGTITAAAETLSGTLTLSGSTTNTVLYSNGSKAVVSVPTGTDGFILTQVAGVPVWAAAGSTSSFNANWITADGTTKVVTHNLGTLDVMVQLYDKTDGTTIGVDSVARTDVNTVTLIASEAPPAAGWRVLISVS